MNREQFEKIVEEALDGLPKDFSEKLDNVEVVVERRPSREDLEAGHVGEGRTLLGLYHGVPLTRRGDGYMLVLPDRISVYMEPIEEACRAGGIPLSEMVRRVVLHEIAHHFGIPDSRLREIGY